MLSRLKNKMRERERERERERGGVGAARLEITELGRIAFWTENVV